MRRRLFLCILHSPQRVLHSHGGDNTLTEIAPQCRSFNFERWTSTGVFGYFFATGTRNLLRARRNFQFSKGLDRTATNRLQPDHSHLVVTQIAAARD